MTIGRTHLQMLHSSYLKEIAEQVLDLLEQRRRHFPLPDFSGPELDEEVNPIEVDQVEVCGRKRNLHTRVQTSKLRNFFRCCVIYLQSATDDTCCITDQKKETNKYRPIGTACFVSKKTAAHPIGDLVRNSQ